MKQRRIWPIACAAALAVALTLTQQPARAHHDAPPPVPGNIQVPDGNTASLKAHAVGTQNYMCLSSGALVAWTPVGPQATLRSRLHLLYVALRAVVSSAPFTIFLNRGTAGGERNAKTLDLKFFCGFSFAEIAAMRRVSERTVQRNWEKARIYLHRAIADASPIS